ncbi:MAG: hypothetical protein HOO93_06855 [Methyloglobulus sp.]|nr:hypothetical protein [Methyloglobulus sp.]
MMKKKVLVVVIGGVPNLYAEEGVDAVYVDIDDIESVDKDDLIPLHPSYVPLLSFAGITDIWPVSDDGNTNDAFQLITPSDSHVQTSETGRPIRLVIDVECGLVQAVYSDSSVAIRAAIKDMDVEGADGDEMATLDDGTEFVGHIEPVLRNGSLVATVFAAFGDECIAADKQQKNYVAGKGQVCPVCGSDIINQQGRLQADGGEAWADIFCFGCSASWQDHYQLVGFNDLNR